MNIFSIFKVAFRALARNKLRSVLTMLGIIIGVAAVIAMVSIGQGAQATIQDQISSVGTNILYVWPAGRNIGGAKTGAGGFNTLTADDADAITRECPAVKATTPIVMAGAQIAYTNQNWNTRIQGVSEKTPDIRKWPIEKGEFFTEGDVRTSARVAVIGKTVADNLFSGVDPVGETVRVRNLPFRIIGVLSAKGQNAQGQDQDDTVFAPYTTVQKKMLNSQIFVNYIMVSAVRGDVTATAERQITDLLRQRHNIRDGAEDFSVRNLTDIADAAQATNQIMTILLGSVAGVSLLVGGIGIMNIMLVSVTERTREIGIRMAIGARSGAVRWQFLIESVVLSVFGGLIGIAFGIITSKVISTWVEWPTLISTFSIVASVLFSIVVGISFGYYPAHKAASLDPIDALRYE